MPAYWRSLRPCIAPLFARQSPRRLSGQAPSSRYLQRFSRTERALHWVHALAFFALLATGLLLYLPSLAALVSRRPLVKAVHIYVAVAWALALLLVVVVGDRKTLRRTLRELDLFDRDDRRWLLGKRTPQGRFNAGQKLHAVVQAAFAVLFAVSGFLLWYGERDTRFRLPGTILLHDGLMYAAFVLVTGHLYLAVVYPRTRHALRGITLGSVREDWARAHHRKWVAAASDLALAAPGGATLAAGGVAEARGEPSPPPSWRRPALWLTGALLAAFVSAFAAVPSLRQLLPATGPAGSDFSGPATASQPPRLGRGLALAQHAVALDQAGRLTAALTLYELAVRAVPGRADFRALLGFALARAGRADEAIAELRRAVRLDPGFAPSRLYLGTVLLQQGQRAEARAQLRRYLELDPAGPGAALARQLLSRP